MLLQFILMNKLALTLNGTPIPAPSGVPTGGLSTTGSHILSTLMTLAFDVAVVLAVVFLILGGIRWVTSRGDAKAVEGARNQIVYAIVGLVIAFLALIIVTIIGRFFHIQLFGFGT